MIFRLLGWLRHFAASEYWRARAVRAERLLEDETLRNREREDLFVSISVAGARGMFGVPPRTGRVSREAPRSALEAVAPIMSGADRMEFETEWLPDAERNNVTRQQAERDFLQELAKRKALRDEPMM